VCYFVASWPRTCVLSDKAIRERGEALKKLSPRQENILQFTGDFVDEHGYPPTVRDIQQACNISSTSVVDYNLNILHREGYLRRSPEISRGIEMLNGSKRRIGNFAVPVLGYIAAGQPLPVLSSEEGRQSEPLEMLGLSSDMLNGDVSVYALRVRGTSMIDALIDDGDVVVIKPTTSVRNGEMVVAWLKKEQEATLKRLFYEGHRVRLQPANSQMKPMFVAPSDVEIQGKVVMVIRRLS
jgi:repressor LexA